MLGNQKYIEAQGVEGLGSIHDKLLFSMNSDYSIPCFFLALDSVFKFKTSGAIFIYELL